MTKPHKTQKTPNNQYLITGLPQHTLILNNKKDADKHTEYLNKKQEQHEKHIQNTIKYTNNIHKIKQLTRRIQNTTNNPHVHELTIQIQNIIRSNIE